MSIKKSLVAALCIFSLIMGSVFDIAGFNLKANANWGGYIVRYNANGGINPPEDNNGYLEGDEVILKDKEGMTNGTKIFEGWTRDPANQTELLLPGDTYPVTAEDGDMTFYAKWREPLQPKNITVSKTGSHTEVEAGEVVTYSLSVKNTGTEDLANVEIDDVMPGVPAENFIDFVFDASSTVGNNPGNVTIKGKRGATIIDFKSGKEAKFTYKVRIPVDSPAEKVWTNTATATAGDGTTANASFNVKAKAITSKLQITKTADKAGAKRNEVIKYTVTLKNIAGVAITNVKFEDSLPVTLTQKTSNASTAITGNKATIGNMDADETITFEYTYAVPAGAVIGSTIENTAKAEDSKGKEYIAKKQVTVLGDSSPTP